MVELRVALEAVRNGATRWDTVAAIRAWLDAGAPPPAQHPPAAPAAAAQLAGLRRTGLVVGHFAAKSKEIKKNVNAVVHRG